MQFKKVLITLQHRDALLCYTDGSSKFHPTKGYMGDLAFYRTTVDICESHATTPHSNQPSGGVTCCHHHLLHKSLNKNLVVISDSQWVFKGATMRACKWKARGWRTAIDLVSHAGLWHMLLQLINTHIDTLESMHMPTHHGIPGNEAANDLAEEGGLANPFVS